MTIGFFGAGKMAEGLLAALPDRTQVIMAERDPARARDVAARLGVRTTGDARAVAAEADLIFVAVRPQDVDALAADVKDLLKPSQTLVSIVAGKTLGRLRAAFGRKARLVRVMPNLALRAGAGMCAVCAAPKTPKADVRAVLDILGNAGETVVLPERAFDAVTALSGSGPAYFAFMAMAMAEGGVALGLKPAVARLLSLQTMYGTAKFLRESGMAPEPFIAGVCTKGGTTEAGMRRLAKKTFLKTVAATLAAAARRSKELAR